MPVSEDEDALLDSLECETEDDPAFAHLREARIQALATELARAKAQRNEGYGTYTRITNEKELMQMTTSTKYCIVHFYKSDFNRCRIMDQHLEELAPLHLQTKFLKIDVEQAPFLVQRLSIKVLPCVIAFVDGIGVDRIVGFEGIGYSEDTFKTEDLEKRFLGCGVIEKIRVDDKRGTVGIARGNTQGSKQDEDRGEFFGSDDEYD